MAVRRINYDEYEGGRVERFSTAHANVTVRFPNISPEERERRRKEAEKALINFYHAVTAQGIDWNKYVKKEE